jgi:glycosyltransferase involved in cell wall biosynthesis
MNKVLIITYYWPPGSGAGVQRWLKFAKYLPETGWEPIIITVDPEFAAYPSADNTLFNEISADLRVFKTRATDWFSFYKWNKTKIPSAGFALNDDNSFRGKMLRFIRGNFFIPDPRKGWNRYAIREACRIIESGKITNIITTSPPHSTQLIGHELKKRYPYIKWIADLRDPWTDIYYYNQFYHTPLAKKIDEHYEKLVLKNADKIITVGRSLKELFIARLPDIKDKIEVVTNGYDEDDFPLLPATNPEVFTISYIGTLSDSYPVSGFMDAASKLAGSGARVRLIFTGAVSPGQKQTIISKSADLCTEFRSYVGHNEAIKYMMESSVLLLIIPDHHSNKSILTGKLFEYLATGKPIFFIGPEDGDAASIIRDAGAGLTAGYDDKEKLENNIITFFQNYNNNTPDSGIKDIQRYSRKALSHQIAEVLNKLNS